VSKEASILVVDDNPLIVNVIVCLLRQAQYTVYTASNGKEALKSLNSNPEIDVIVCDVMMPEMDGYTFYDIVRSKTEYANIPFLFLTGLSSNEEVTQGRELGVDDYLVKPFQPEELLSIIKGKIQRAKNLKQANKDNFEHFRQRLTQTLSHELRTPLVAINTGTELLLTAEAAKELPPRTAKLLSAIQAGGKRLEKLASDLSIIQQLETGLAEKQFNEYSQVYQIDSLISTLKKSTSSLLNDNNFTLIVNCLIPELKTHINATQVIDILTRLIDNAIKFSKLAKSTPNSSSIELNCYTKENKIFLAIKDFGIGFDISKVDQIQTTFEQLERDTQEQQGCGLGLSIAKQYAQINKGRLLFSANIPQGTIACLELPISII